VLTRPEFGEGNQHFSLSIISATLEPVPTMAPGSLFQQTLTPTHTVDNAPPLDVLLVPGGLGSSDKDTDPLVEFIRERFSSLMYLITICTGADLAARAGVLDGRKATTNKSVWVMPPPPLPPPSCISMTNPTNPSPLPANHHHQTHQC
jgi:putative intracellular protease/amidase